jgi:tripartite-type tricarboxylate transporter receptor subunit TctC
MRKTRIQLSRRSFVAGAATGLIASPNLVRAQAAWPVPQITLVAPFPAGGTVDQFCRMVQPGLGTKLGATVIVENKPGAQGSIGAAQVAKAKPDGSSWLFVFDTHAVNPSLQNLPFDTEKDLQPVLLIGTSPHILVCHPDKPWKSFADLMADAKKDPGKLNYGSIGTGSLGHLTGVLLSKRAGIVLTHVPFRGGGPLLNDTVAGHIDTGMASSALYNQQIGGGALRPLIQTGATRAGNAKDTPTAIELGYTGFESYAWWGVFAPKGTPAELVDKMRTTLIEIMKEPMPFKQITENMQIQPSFGGATELSAWLGGQMKLWGDVVRENGIKAGN